MFDEIHFAIRRTGNRINYLFFLCLLLTFISCRRELEFNDLKSLPPAYLVLAQVNNDLSFVSIVKLNPLWDQEADQRGEVVKDAKIAFITESNDTFWGLYDLSERSYLFAGFIGIEGNRYKLYGQFEGHTITGDAYIPTRPDVFETRLSYPNSTKVELSYKISDTEPGKYDYYLYDHRVKYLGERIYVNKDFFSGGEFVDPWNLQECMNPPYPAEYDNPDSIIIVKISRNDRIFEELLIQNTLQINSPFYIPGHISGNLENKSESIYGHFYGSLKISSTSYVISDLSEPVFTFTLKDKSGQSLPWNSFQFIELRARVNKNTSNERIFQLRNFVDAFKVSASKNNIITLFNGCDGGDMSQFDEISVRLRVRDSLDNYYSTNTVDLIPNNQNQLIELELQ